MVSLNQQLSAAFLRIGSLLRDLKIMIAGKEPKLPVAQNNNMYLRSDKEWVDIHASDLSVETYSKIGLNATTPIISRTIPITINDTNVDLSALCPKGTGAFSFLNPNGVASDRVGGGGNKRGVNAVDLQLSITSATQIASGAYSFSCGTNNTASGHTSFTYGNGNTAVGQYSVVGGNVNTLYSPYGRAHGQLCGDRYNRGDIWNTGSIETTGSGNYQHSRYSLWRKTTNTTSTALTFDGAAVVSTIGPTQNVLTFPNNTILYFRGRCIGKSGNNCVIYTIEFMAKRPATGNLQILGTPTVTKLYADTALSSTGLSITAVTTYISINVVGIASTNIKWGCYLDATEIMT